MKIYVVQVRLVAQISHHELVGLVENAIVEVGACQIRGSQNFFDERRNFAQREISYRHAVHKNFVIRTVIAAVVRRKNFGIVTGHEAAASDGNNQFVVARTVTAEDERPQTFRIAALNPSGGCSVAEERSRRLVLDVDIFRVDA